MTNPQENEGPDPAESGAGTGETAFTAGESVAVGETEPTGTPAEIEKWKDVAARATADLDNFRKRMAREKFEAIQYANRGLLEQLLPIIDNFEMGLKAAESSDGGGSIILQGMAMVRKQLEDFLIEQGVEIIPSDGLAFDPNVHEALKQEPHGSLPEGHVIYTLRRGYRLKDRVLRAANVVVSSGPEPVS
jgi:molecular chaperone GrpE